MGLVCSCFVVALIRFPCVVGLPPGFRNRRRVRIHGCEIHSVCLGACQLAAAIVVLHAVFITFV